jgi:hypothetical protein
MIGEPEKGEGKYPTPAADKRDPLYATTPRVARGRLTFKSHTSRQPWGAGPLELDQRMAAHSTFSATLPSYGGG